MSRKSKWNVDTVQKASDEIHGGKFIVQKVELLSIGKDKTKRSYITLKCKLCNDISLIRVSSHITYKSGCKNCLKWTVENLQIKSDEIYSNKFIIHQIKNGKEINKNKSHIYVNLECKVCKYNYWTQVNYFINQKQGCRSCNGRPEYTKKSAQLKSDQIHNFKFIVYDIKKMKRKNTDENATHLNLECKYCGERKWMLLNSHITNKQGCGSHQCKGTIDRKTQINFLQSNQILASEQYNLYFLKFIHKITNEQFYKVGKTKKEINDRFKIKQYSNYNIETCQVVKGTHLWVAEQEDKFINKYKSYQYIPNEKFGGHTECFSLEIEKEFNNSKEI